MVLDGIEHLRRAGLDLVNEIRAGWNERGILQNDPVRKRQLSECLKKLNGYACAWDETPEQEARARDAVLEIAAAALRPHWQPT